MKNSHSESYAAAGVDVTAGYEAVERIKPMVESTYIPGVMGTLGGFGGMFAPDLAGMKKPVLVSGTDGVGTKLKLAFLMDKHEMCIRDRLGGVDLAGAHGHELVAVVGEVPLDQLLRIVDDAMTLSKLFFAQK